jgi:hypothetical protein
MPYSKLTFLRRNDAQQSKKRAENYPFLRRNATQQINAQKSNLFLMRRNAALQINFFAQKCRAAS